MGSLMSSTINASTASGGGVITTADASGILQLQTAGVTGLTIDASQNVTLAKGLTVGASAAPAFSAYQSIAQTITAVTVTKLQFQSEEFDTANCFDNATNYRFTPNVAGYYQVSGGETITTAPCGHQLVVYKNGSAFKRIFASTGGALTDAAYGSCLIYLNGSTDYIELYVTYLTVTNNISASPTNTYFSAFLARSA